MPRPKFRGGFLAGPSTTWEMDPTTRCVTSPHPVPRLATIAPLHAEHGGNLFRVFQRDDLVGVPRLPVDDLVLVAKLEHELDHMQRHLATSYGLVYHLIRSRMADLFFRRPSLSASDDAARLPWYPTQRRRIRSEEHAVDRNEKRYVSYRSLLNIWTCDGTSPSSPNAGECRAAFAALACDLFPEGLAMRPPERAQHGRRAWFPVWNDEQGRPFKMGAAALLEMLALSRELSLMRYANLPEHRDEAQFGSSIYRQAAYVWKDVFKLPLILNTTPSQIWRRLGYRSISAPPWELQLAVDLALWMPLGPNGAVPADARFGWEDIHPGWRFARILNLLRQQTKWHVEPAITHGANDWVRSTQKEWCQQLGWPAPDELIDVWMAWLADGFRRQTLERRYIEDDRSRWAASLNLLAYRQSAPAAVLLGFPDAGGAAVNWFDAVFGPDEENVLHVYSDESRIAKVEALGYPFPVAYGLIQAIELFAEHLGNSTQETLDWRLARLKRLGLKLETCIKTYAKRHYGTEVAFDGKLPDK